MATHSSVFAWRIPGTGEPGGLLSLGLHRVGQDWSDLAASLCLCESKLTVENSSRDGNIRPPDLPPAKSYSFLMASFVSSTSESILLSLCVPCSARGICWLTSTFSFNSLFGVVFLLLFLPFNSAFQLFSPVFHWAVLCMGPLCGGEWPDWSRCECSAGAKSMAPNRFFLLTSPCFHSLEPRSYL